MMQFPFNLGPRYLEFPFKIRLTYLDCCCYFERYGCFLKVNLLDVYPGLRSFLQSNWLEKLNHGFTKYVFAALVILLFIGAQPALGLVEAFKG